MEAETPLRSRYVLEAVRKVANNAGLYRINAGHSSADNRDAMREYWRNGHATIGTWGAPVDELFPDLSPGDTITADEIAPEYKDPVTNGIDQEKLSSFLEPHTDAPGRAAGSISRFFNDLEDGTVILGNIGGVAPGVIDGPAVYKPNGPAQEAIYSHVFVRPVSWATGPNGDVLEIPPGDLPAPLRPNPTTCTRVQDASRLLELASFIGFLAEQGNG